MPLPGILKRALTCRATALCALPLAGCTGQLYSESAPSGERVDGIVYYERAFLLRTTDTTLPDCTHQISSAVITLADPARRRVLRYAPGLLEGHSLGVTLNADGTLAAVNASSDPDRGQTAANIAAGLSSLAGTALVPHAQPATARCTPATTVSFRRLTSLSELPGMSP